MPVVYALSLRLCQWPTHFHYDCASSLRTFITNRPLVYTLSLRTGQLSTHFHYDILATAHLTLKPVSNFSLAVTTTTMYLLPAKKAITQDDLEVLHGTTWRQEGRYLDVFHLLHSCFRWAGVYFMLGDS